MCFLLAQAVWAQSDLIEFQDGGVASAQDVNANFQTLADQIGTLTEDLDNATSKLQLQMSVNCDEAGRSALQDAIYNHGTLNRQLRLDAAGACGPLSIPNGYNVQVLGTGNLSFSYIEADGPKPAYIVFVGPDSTVALVGATIDATGVDGGLRNRNGQLYIAITTISNAVLSGIETLAGVTEVFGPVGFGDDDDSSVSVTVGFNGVFYIQNVGIFGVPTTVTLKSTDTVLRVQAGATFTIAEVGTELFASGAEIEVDTGGWVQLDRDTTFQLSSKLKVANGAFLSVSAEADQLVSISGDLQVLSASVDFDFDESPGGSLVHRGNVSIELNGNLSINGDPLDPALVKVAVTDGVEPVTNTTVSVIGHSNLGVVSAELHHTLMQTATSTLYIDSEASLIGGLDALSADFGSTVLFLNSEPSVPVLRQRGGTVWDMINGNSHCQ